MEFKLDSQTNESVPITIDKDPSLNYEVDNFATKIFGSLAAFFLNIAPPRVGNFLIDRTTSKGKEVRNKATTYYALDTLYTTHKFSSQQGVLKGTIEFLWFKLGNPRAVRNRLKLVKKFLKEIILEKMAQDQDQRMSIFSLGCGSARAITETLYELKKGNKIDINTFDIKLLDKAPEALELSKKIIDEHQLEESCFSFLLNKVRNFDIYLGGNKADIIEMVGVLDYLDDNNAIEIFKKIYYNLEVGGFFITANIRKNIETPFVNKTVGWHMIYREPTDLMHLLLAAGFEREKIKIIYEPLKTHGVAFCKK